MTTKTRPLEPQNEAVEDKKINSGVASKEDTTMVNLLDFAEEASVSPTLDLIQLSADETAIILFTPESKEVSLHYCKESGIEGYVQCNGDDCILCRVGRKQVKRLLLPVYLPATGTVGILPVNPLRRPHDLLPQLLNVLKSKTRQVLFVSRPSNFKYVVATSPLKDDVDSGETQIKSFLEKFNKGEVDLTAAYAIIDNEQLAATPEIAKMIELKGIDLSAIS